MSENYLKIIELGKNVRKFLLGEVQKCQKMTWLKYKNVRTVNSHDLEIWKIFPENIDPGLIFWVKSI